MSIPVPPPPVHHSPDFDRLLASKEGHDFEVKAAAFGAVDKWLKGTGELERTTDIDGQPFMSVLYAVTSLLNGSGGTLLLGALEKRVYGSSEGAKDLPRAAQYLILGLEGVDFAEGEFDTYTRTLWEKLHHRICPTPRRWLEFHPHEVDGKIISSSWPSRSSIPTSGSGPGAERKIKSSSCVVTLHPLDGSLGRRYRTRSRSTASE
jgi:hypothetical protein